MTRLQSNTAEEVAALSPTASKANDDDTTAAAAISDFFATDDVTFESMGVTSPVLLDRIQNQLRLKRPSAVQAAAYAAIQQGGDVTIGAETGSGKTLAYLLPLVNDILERKQNPQDDTGYLGYDFCPAIVLVPNKELVNQVVRMAVDICGGRANCLVTGSTGSTFGSKDKDGEQVDEKTVVRLAVMSGGLEAPQDFAPFRKAIGLGGDEPPVDICISTPAAIAPLGLKPAHIDMFADVQTLVIDEADMLLDGGYIRPLEQVLMGFRRADKLDESYGVNKTQHVFVAATLPDYGLRSVDAYLQKKFPNATRVTMAGMHNARHYGLSDQTVWIEEESNKARMEKLVEMLETPPEEGGLQGEKVMVFLNSVDNVEGANGAMQ
jgi:superfamily II DNA/RNA helicase